MEARLIALDIDGTLIPPGGGHQALPDAELTDVIGRLVQAGVVIALASGRMFPGTLRIAQHLRLTSPLICQQGSTVCLPSGEITHQFSLAPDIAHELVEFAQEEGWPFAWFDALRYLASLPNRASEEFGLVSGVQPEYRDNPHLSGIDPTGVDIISTQEHANGIHRLLESRYGDRVHLLDFPFVTAAHAAEASKGSALKLLADDLGIPQAQVLAVGDSVNDVSMLRWAGHGVTLPHCDRYARVAADEVLTDEGITGVAKLLRRVLRTVGG